MDRPRPPRSSAVLLVLALLIASTTPAYAYVDPNAGGALFQILTPLLALVAAAFATSKLWLKSLWQRITRRPPKQEPPE